jgi:molybdopterin synthase sulfur carrier subunit
VRILFFGRLRDIAGAGALEHDEAFSTLSALRRSLSLRSPELAAALDDPAIRVAVDRCLVGADADLRGAREVAFMPPMSGG